MMTELEERFVAAFEQIAEALAGIDDTQKRQFAKQWPEPGKKREAVITRVPTEEDLIREEQGASDEPIEEWIGLREREFIERQAGSATTEERESGGGSFETPEGKS
jgi:uncharacterized membrane protein